jgi:hypothetical protein
MTFEYGVPSPPKINVVNRQPMLLLITRNMGQDGDGHAHFDQIWRPNITINYMGVDQNIKF